MFPGGSSVTDEKEFDPFDHCDADWTKAVAEVGKSLPDWRLDSIPVMSASAAHNRFRQVSSTLKMNALAQKLRRGAV